ncbi:MAG: hypothetical protein HY983_00435 [Candidatus Magasanikbacteria bacterium]|nr:hypothetical protein [Candidatus Magasanikbacteria bacterium]
MKRLCNFFIEHKAIVLLATALGFFVISPSFLYPLLAGNSYRGVDIGSWVDYSYYLGKGREILEGHSLGNDNLKIGKDASSDPHQVYIEYLFLGPLRLLGLGDVMAFYITQLYYVVAIFGIIGLALLIYFFILYLSGGNKLLAITIALFTIGGYTLVKLYHDPVTMERPDFNMFVRPIIPLYGLLTLFAYLNVLIRSLRSDRWKNVYWSGLLFGTLFYVYPFTWTFAGALTGSLLLVYIVFRKTVQVKKVLAVMAIGLVVGSYTLVRTVTFPYSTMGKQIMYFAIDDTNNHTPYPVSKLSVLVLILLALYAYKNRKDESLPLLLAIVLASWICLNQQVITGQSPQLLHYFWYFTIPTSIVVGSYLAWSLVQSMQLKFVQKYGWIALVALIVVAFFTTARQQYLGTLATFDLRQHAQDYRPIFDVLNRDPKPGVILDSQAFFAKYLIVYTRHDLFWHSQALVFNTPIERIIDALYVYAYLDKETRNDFVARLKRSDYESGPGDYGDDRQYPFIYRFLTSYWSGFSPNAYSFGLAAQNPVVMAKRDEGLSRLFDGYKKVASSQGIMDILKKSEVNYIVWDRNQNPTWDLSFLKGKLQELVVSNGVYLYKVVW